MSRNRSWVVFTGKTELHYRKSGPGIEHKQGRKAVHLFDSTDARAEAFKPTSVDAPKKASRTRPAAWGQPFGGAK